MKERFRIHAYTNSVRTNVYKHMYRKKIKKNNNGEINLPPRRFFFLEMAYGI